MTIVGAIQALKEGQKVRNRYWDKSQYIYLDKQGFLAQNAIPFDDSFTLKLTNKMDLRLDCWEIYQEPKPILDDIEKEYLNNVIKPFRNRITKIRKFYHWDEYIVIYLKEREETVCLPSFPKNSMYKGMIPMKYYTLDELGL